MVEDGDRGAAGGEESDGVVAQIGDQAAGGAAGGHGSGDDLVLEAGDAAAAIVDVDGGVGDDYPSGGAVGGASGLAYQVSGAQSAFADPGPWCAIEVDLPAGVA